jgi:hypothetical protein
MSTPVEHADRAESLATEFYGSDPLYQRIELVTAHVELSRAAGTGDHYEAADQLLASVDDRLDTHGVNTLVLDIRTALAHALLADRD